MATIEAALTLVIPASIVGPESEYEKRRAALKTATDNLVKQAEAITVVDSVESAKMATDAGRVLQAQSAEVERFFKPVKSQIDALKKPVLESEKSMAQAIDESKKRLGGLIQQYTAEQERIRREEERKAREEAMRAAQEEQLARAVELESEGRSGDAEQILQEQVYVPVAIQTEAPKMAGTVGRTIYKCRVDNFKALVKAVADGLAPIQCLVADESYLNKRANLDKDGFSMPGCSLVKNSNTGFRA